MMTKKMNNNKNKELIEAGKFSQSIESIDHWISVNIKGTRHDLYPDDIKKAYNLLSESELFYSNKQWLEKFYFEVTGCKFEDSFEDDDFDEFGNLDDMFFSLEFLFTFKDKGEVRWSFHGTDDSEGAVDFPYESPMAIRFADYVYFEYGILDFWEDWNGYNHQSII